LKKAACAGVTGNALNPESTMNKAILDMLMSGSDQR
jgi:hypothetical protein